MRFNHAACSSQTMQLSSLKGQPFSLIGIMKRSRELHQGYLEMEYKGGSGLRKVVR